MDRMNAKRKDVEIDSHVTIFKTYTYPWQVLDKVSFRGPGLSTLYHLPYTIISAERCGAIKCSVKGNFN